MASNANLAFMQIAKRAETNQRSTLLETFVDVGPLLALLSTGNNQVIYGRRGTGKTHALSFLAEQQEDRGDAVALVDLSNIGSTGGLYANDSIPMAQRATTLLVDVLQSIHESRRDYFARNAEKLDLSQAAPLLDELGETLAQVRVVGSIQSETKASATLQDEAQSGSEISLGKAGPIGKLTDLAKSSGSATVESKRLESGPEVHRVQFGSVGSVLRKLTKLIAPCRIWVLLDEWSSLPIDLQPYLADFLRRSMFSVTGVVFKIAAIEQRTRFRIIASGGDYTGIELGADATADLNLDDYMVFENDAERAKAFLQELLFKHYLAIAEGEAAAINSSKEFLSVAFTQVTTFEELVRAAEGVPRDALNILSLAAQHALEDRISIHHIRRAASEWYQRGKEPAFKESPEVVALMRWIIDKVIGDRRARAFMLRADQGHAIIDILFDARVLHVLKRNISARDQPGVRYVAYKLDYGCYVDLITTTRAPIGLVPNENGDEEYSYAEVPTDDYRSIRRAILDLDEYENYLIERIQHDTPF